MWERNDFKWIVGIGIVLSIHSGFINTIALKGAFSLTVTHLTGLVTKSAFLLTDGKYQTSFNALVILLGFVGGAFLTGLLLGNNRFRVQPRYGLILMMESTLLLIASGLLIHLEYPHDKSRYAFILVSMAVGMQNAMFSTFSGAVVRTSHLTGLLNDGAMILGQFVRYKLFVRRKKAETWKLLVFYPIIVGFAIGCMIGSECYDAFSVKALFIPATTLGVTGTIFFVTVTARNRHILNNVKSVDLKKAEEGAVEDSKNIDGQTEQPKIGKRYVELDDDMPDEEEDLQEEDSWRHELKTLNN